MKKLELNAPERILLSGQLNTRSMPKGNYDDIKRAIKIAGLVEFTEKEIKRYGIVVLPKGGVNFNDKTSQELTLLELEDAEAQMLVDHFKKLDKQGEILNERWFISLYEKILEIETLSSEKEKPAKPLKKGKRWA